METGDAQVVVEEKEDERNEEDDEFPAPPSLGDLEELAREQEVPATPRTLRRADSLRQKMAAKRIQRTWKHFYQVFASIFYQLYPSSTNSVQNPKKILETFFYRELEEKKAHTDNRVEADLVEEEQEREDAISDIQVDI